MDGKSLLPYIKFWTYLLLLIPSTVCSLFVLYFLLFDRILRRACHNHMIILLLFICFICQLTIYPWMLYFHINGKYWPRSWIFCSIWSFIDWGLYITQVVLFAWTSIERHILIFHDQWIVTRKNRLCIHYLPPIYLTIYCFIYYSLVYFFPPCESFINDSSNACMISCLYNNRVFYLWETIVNQLIPNSFIIIFSLTLILRVLWQKHRLHQQIQWRKHRKMTIQLLSISFLYLFFSFPNIFIILLYIFGLSIDPANVIKKYTEFFSYLVILFFPFVCILPLPELRKKIRKILSLRRYRHERMIHPEILTGRNLQR